MLDLVSRILFVSANLLRVWLCAATTFSTARKAAAAAVRAAAAGVERRPRGPSRWITTSCCKSRRPSLRVRGPPAPPMHILTSDQPLRGVGACGDGGFGVDGVAAVDSQGWQQRLRQQPEKASAKPGKRVSSVFLACFPGCAEDGVGISRVSGSPRCRRRPGQGHRPDSRCREAAEDAGQHDERRGAAHRRAARRHRQPARQVSQAKSLLPRFQRAQPRAQPRPAVGAPGGRGWH